jgi:hypothetical protein
MRGLVFLSIVACGVEPAPMIAAEVVPELEPEVEPKFEIGAIVPEVSLVPAAFELEPAVHEGAELIDDRLELRTAQPVMCEGCDDFDGDGLADAWEAIVLDAFRPAIRMAVDEPFLTDPNATILEVARIFPVSFEPLVVRALIAIPWHRDYGSTCGGIGAHNGDPERVALELEALPDGAVTIARAYTAGHEFTSADSSHLYASEELRELEYDTDPRWIVYASLNKHASYANSARCADASAVPCVRETCGAAAELLPDVINAGEPEAPLIDDLSTFGFPGDLIWSDQDFCGGLTRILCSAPLSTKLLRDPFEVP